MTRARLVAATVLLAVLRAHPAGAAPLVDPTSGGMVFTGPTSAHVSSLYWNPAAIGLVRGFHVYASGQLHADPYVVERASIDTSTGEPSEAQLGAGGKSFDPAKGTLLTPGGFIGFTWDASGDTLAIGFGIHAPFVDVQPRDHDQLRYHTTGGSLSSTFGTFALSYRITSRWIAGAGLSIVKSRATLHFSIDQQLAACTGRPCVVEDPTTTSFFDLDAKSSGFDVAFEGGLLWKARDDLWLALAYHSPPGFASVSLTGSAKVIPAPAAMRPPAHGDAEVNFALPHILEVGARWDALPGRWQVIGHVTWIALSAVDHLDLRLAGPELRDAGVREWILRYRGLSNAVQLETGLETPAGQASRWGLRLRFDSGGVDNAHVAPEQIAGPSLDLAGGLEHPIWGNWSVTLAVSAGLMLPRHVQKSAFSPKAQIDCAASGFDLDRCQGAREGSAIDTAAGDYQRYNFGAMLGLSWDYL
jgi:long-subunit fatty acid transport protein